MIPCGLEPIPEDCECSSKENSNSHIHPLVAVRNSQHVAKLRCQPHLRPSSFLETITEGPEEDCADNDRADFKSGPPACTAPPVPRITDYVVSIRHLAHPTFSFVTPKANVPVKHNCCFALTDPVEYLVGQSKNACECCLPNVLKRSTDLSSRSKTPQSKNLLSHSTHKHYTSSSFSAHVSQSYACSSQHRNSRRGLSNSHGRRNPFEFHSCLTITSLNTLLK